MDEEIARLEHVANAIQEQLAAGTYTLQVPPGLNARYAALAMYQIG
jgi:hypothetical protein